MNSKYEIGDYVNFYNDTKLARIIAKLQHGSTFFYRIQYYGQGSVDRIPEGSLVPAHKEYDIPIY